eukprot:GFUD01012389.1.p3 GENE.GFUD01012389.1~~GFUD01012389.1.p3  ORF type:complete len:107 (-),score=31.11 GFUD01012389.1:281-601(-)
MRYQQILAIIVVCSLTVQTRPQLLRQLMDLLGVKGGSMSNRLVEEQEHNINREIRARKVSDSTLSLHSVLSSDTGRLSPDTPSCVCRCDCCPCCPCGEEQFQYVDT